MGKKWEYMRLEFNRDQFGRQFDEAGEVGWELVCVSNEGANWKAAYFKREVK